MSATVPVFIRTYHDRDMMKWGGAFATKELTEVYKLCLRNNSINFFYYLKFRIL